MSDLRASLCQLLVPSEMLFADKRALETDLKLGLLEIREKELNFYTTNCAHLAFLSSIFAGFASTALMTHVPKEPVILHFLYLLVTVAALGLQLAALVSTTLLSMVGPGLALRGPDGSMHVAIDSMIGEYRTAFFQLLLGLLALHASVATFCWLMLNPIESIGMTICVVAALAFELRYVKTVFARFQLPASATVTGKFEGSEAMSAGASAGLRARTEIGTLSKLIQQQSALEAAKAMEAARQVRDVRQARGLHGAFDGAPAAGDGSAGPSGSWCDLAAASSAPSASGGDWSAAGSLAGGGSRPRGNGKQRTGPPQEREGSLGFGLAGEQYGEIVE